MANLGNTPAGGDSDERPLTARSVVASVLLGTQPPALPGRLLVEAGALFGLAEGTVRVALSRMVAAGELEAGGDGSYRLAGHLLGRQARQDESRHPPARGWDGSWITAVVTADSRTAADRAALRDAMRTGRLAALREGVRLRPDNLGPHPVLPSPLNGHCTWFTSRPATGDGTDLTRTLWPLDAWAARTDALLERMERTLVSLRQEVTAALAPCFVLAAAALRHLGSDPLLPAPLLPPAWNGDRLRTAYDTYEHALQHLLRTWFRTRLG